jgi:hypothetical protein
MGGQSVEQASLLYFGVGSRLAQGFVELEKGALKMKKFTRQNPPTSKLRMNLHANSALVRHVLEPGEYELRIQSAQLQKSRNMNQSVVLDVVEMTENKSISLMLWIHGPNACNNSFAAENQMLLAQMLELAGHDVSGDVDIDDLVPELDGLVFTARLGIDSKDGRPCNKILTIYSTGVV